MAKPKIALIAACGRQRELGAGNALLWHLPDDFQWFIRHTKGKSIVMGRKTMESLGRPLKNRRNLVLTRSQEPLPEGFESMPNWEAVWQAVADEPELMVIGGAEIYAQSLPWADAVYLTEVQGDFPHADAFFPAMPEAQWNCVSREPHSRDERHAFAFDLCVYEPR
ncbi:MAG: dihydrofolate reductase [Bacteroidia bacterium]